MFEFIFGAMLGAVITGLTLITVFRLEEDDSPIPPRMPDESFEQYAYRLSKEGTRAEAAGGREGRK